IGNTSSTNADALNASSATLTLSGSGTPLNITSKGSFSAATSTVQYTGTSTTNITAVTYNNLSLLPSSGTPTYRLGTAGSQTITVNNDFVAGNGTNAPVVDHDTNSPVLNVSGNFTSYSAWSDVAQPVINLKPNGTKNLFVMNGDLNTVNITGGTSTP